MDDVELARHIIQFNPQDKSTHASWTEITPDLLKKPNLIPWPPKLAPQPQPISPNPKSNDPLPRVNCLVVTWTVAEAQALADVLTPGYPSSSWYRYDRFFESYKKNIRHGAPALQENRLGIFYPTDIGNNKVLCFKSELHLSQDGPKLPVQDLWRQIIQETQPKLVVTTGTAGGIGSAVKLGDVVVGRKVRFHCNRTFKNAPFNNVEYQNETAPPTSYFELSTKNLIPINANHLPPSPQSTMTKHN